jgi:Undecaprenyl-phosphate glucose phosphotransferase
MADQSVMPDTLSTVVSDPVCRAAPRPLSKGIIIGAVGAIDGVVVFIAWGVAYYGYYLEVLGAPAGVVPYATLGVLGAAATVMLLRLLRAYAFEQLDNLPLQLNRVTVAMTMMMAGMVAIGFLSKTSGDWSRGWLLSWYGGGILLLSMSRAVVRLQLRRWDAAGRFKIGIVLVGDAASISTMLQQIARNPYFPGTVIGIFYDRISFDGPMRRTENGAIGLTFSRTVPIDRIIIGLPWNEESRAAALFDRLKFIPCDVRMAFDTEMLQYRYRAISEIGGLPVLHVYERPLKDWQVIAKRAEDLIISGLGILLGLPLTAVIALLIKLDSPGPVFFFQPRHGFNHSIFHIVKFRTMYTGSGDPTGVAQTKHGDDARITRIGRVLRRSSMDELPQLWNVWRGDMSIVGPRPHPLGMRASGARYDELVEDYAARHRVKPGITGWAQVNGWRGPTLNDESARKRIEHDLDYIENWSIWFDLKIILMTLPILTSRKNAV